MNYDLIIIGGGASGLCTAIKCKKNNISVLVIEHTSKVGKKILSTGNGKCNLTNSFCKVDLFEHNPEGILPFHSSGDPSFISAVISQFDCDDTINFFKTIGVLTSDREGYIYPRSEQASTIRDMLVSSASRLGVDIITDHSPSKVLYDGDAKYRFSVDDQYYSRNLVIAAGGMSMPSSGSDGTGYIIAESLGHSIIDPIPSLCGIRCSNPFFKEIAGVRNNSSLTVSCNGSDIIQCAGNLQFTSYGVSGIPVFQISSTVGRLLSKGLQPTISIDLLPEFDQDFLNDHLSEEGHYLNGIINSKLADMITHLIKKYRQSMSYRGSDGSVVSAVSLIKDLTVHPVALNPFEDAQTTCGGVCTDEIDPQTMMSLIKDGLYFTGEIIDVDGICGGYNLQWAWSTAHIASTDISMKNRGL